MAKKPAVSKNSGAIRLKGSAARSQKAAIREAIRGGNRTGRSVRIR